MTTIALNSQTTPALGGPAFIELAASTGFGVVELAGAIIEHELTAVRESVDRTGVDVLGVSPTPELLDWHIEFTDGTADRLDQELGWAAALGAAYFVLPFMRETSDRAAISSGLDLAARIAEPHGIRLAVEPIGHFDVLRRAHEIAELLGRFDAQRVGLLLDSFHFFRARNELADLSAFAELEILAVQVSNANDRPLDELLGYRDRTFPLDGPFPVAELCAAVLADRPSTPLIVEVIGDLVADMDAPASAARAKEHLDRLTAQPTIQESSRV
jgi:sugar phosphate isomerase/epimerase